MALNNPEQPKRLWKTPTVTTALIELPVMLTACTGSFGTCNGDGSTCCNSDTDCDPFNEPPQISCQMR